MNPIRCHDVGVVVSAWLISSSEPTWVRATRIPVAIIALRSPTTVITEASGIGPRTPTMPVIMVIAAAAGTGKPSESAISGITGRIAVMPTAWKRVGA